MSETSKSKLKKINGLVDSLCGIYSRVARKIGVHRTFVSRVASGEKTSEKVAQALIAEYDRVTEK